MDTLPIFCTSEAHTSAPHEPKHESTHTTIQASSQDSSAPNQERSETSQTISVPIHDPESGGATLGNESMDFQGSSGESERASSCPLGDFSKRKRSLSAHLSCPPTPLVVVPAPSCSTFLRERFSPQTSDCSQSMVVDPDEPDSAPSDDENDADYPDHSDTENASESLHPCKRRRRGPGDASAASRVLKHLSSETPPAKQPESPQEDSNPESESIPIQGFLQLRTKGTEVIYSLEFSQTHFSSFFSDKQMKFPQTHPRTAYPTTKTPYSPEEDELIIDLKAQKLSWDEIEDQFAERFPHRKKSSLQVHYCNKLKHLTKERRKRRVKSCE
ncbi:hypothetical protein EIK77_000913 [Talaromyces pinophilus]|nr:hypothetical protein EIK77_000913 [Talaromyces pinophilus]